MTQKITFYAAGLPEAPIDAAQAFHHQHVPSLRSLFASAIAAAPESSEDLPAVTIVFEPAGYAHASWRLAAIQGLAREAAPLRVNGIVGDDEPAIDEGLEYLAEAAGITGQLLSLRNG